MLARERMRACRRAATLMLRRDHGVALSIQNFSGPKGPLLLLGSCATPPAPGSCPASGNYDTWDKWDKLGWVRINRISRIRLGYPHGTYPEKGYLS